MTQRKNPFPDPERKKLLMTLLKVMGGHKVEVSFSGGGDSGSIEGVFLMDSDGNEIKIDGAEFEWHEYSSSFDNEAKGWNYTTAYKVMPLSDILTQICDDCLETTNLDWYNNEGGQGSLEIDLKTDPPTINLNVGINYTHTDDHNYDFSQDGEEENEKNELA